MSRYYLSYRLILKEPLIMSDGSQLGNVLQTQDYIPGSSILGLCAGLYLRGNKGKATTTSGAYLDEFRSLFLSDNTLYSPAYPLKSGAKGAFPMPMSVFGCKYYGFNEPIDRVRDMHGFKDFLYKDLDLLEACDVPGCGAPLEHKSGYTYYDNGEYYNLYLNKEIISHNQVGEVKEEKRLFSFEAISRGQQFYGEIAFRNEGCRNLLIDLLAQNPNVRLGKARNRGYGLVEINDPTPEDQSFRSRWSRDLKNNIFSIYLFSNTILVDRGLRYCTYLDAGTLAYWLGLDDPDSLEVEEKMEDARLAALRSFYKTARVLGFNQHRKMPLPFEQAVLKGSVFTVRYKGGVDISAKLKNLQEEGIGLRRNEGFGQVVINHTIHDAETYSSGEADI